MTASRSVPDRLGRKQGRFSADFEVNDINAGLRGLQQAFGDEILYYRFQRADSEMNDVYDEGVGAGKVFIGPIPVNAIKVIHIEGNTEQNDTGFYYNDDVHVSLSKDQMNKIGMTSIDIHHESYLKDRLVYDDRVFRVTGVQVLGQVQRRDIIVNIEGTHMKPDELVNDPQFAAWSA